MNNQLQVGILLYENDDSLLFLEAEIPPALGEIGISANFAAKSLHDLGMDAQRVAEYVTENPSDAWIVCAGSLEVLQWFSQQAFPTLALYGRFADLPIASVCPRQTTSLEACIKRLVELNHRIIVMFAREDRRKPRPGRYEQNFLNILSAHGLPSSNENLPDWEGSLTGLRNCLESLFKEAPPTAMLFQESHYMMATQQFLAQRGMNTPKHFSLFCSQHNPSFEWSEPPIAHSKWDNRKVIERITNWARRATYGDADTEETLFDTVFIEGGSIGPAHSLQRNQERDGQV